MYFCKSLEHNVLRVVSCWCSCNVIVLCHVDVHAMWLCQSLQHNVVCDVSKKAVSKYDFWFFILPWDLAQLRWYLHNIHANNKIFTRTTKYSREQQNINANNKISTRTTKYSREQQNIHANKKISTRSQFKFSAVCGVIDLSSCHWSWFTSIRTPLCYAMHWYKQLVQSRCPRTT